MRSIEDMKIVESLASMIRTPKFVPYICLSKTSYEKWKKIWEEDPVLTIHPFPLVISSDGIVRLKDKLNKKEYSPVVVHLFDKHGVRIAGL